MTKSKSTTELFKKAVLVAIGATAVTADKLNTLIDEFVEKGEMSEGQAKSFKEEIKDKAMAEKESLEKKIQESTQKAVAKIMKELGVATIKDLEKLEKKLVAKIDGVEYSDEEDNKQETCSESSDEKDCTCENCN